MKKIISYHVFTDGIDEYVATEDEANIIWDKWIADGAQNIRIYKLTSENSNDIDAFGEEDCIKAIGDFPY